MTPYSLKGKALRDRAAALNIPGRSKMKADELRAAIAEWNERVLDRVAEVAAEHPTPWPGEAQLADHLPTCPCPVCTSQDLAPKRTEDDYRQVLEAVMGIAMDTLAGNSPFKKAKQRKSKATKRRARSRVNKRGY